MTIFKNMSHLRTELEPQFEERFFARRTCNAHNDAKRTWSVKDQSLAVIATDGSKVIYKPYIHESGPNQGKYTLTISHREQA